MNPKSTTRPQAKAKPAQANATNLRQPAPETNWVAPEREWTDKNAIKNAKKRDRRKDRNKDRTGGATLGDISGLCRGGAAEESGGPGCKNIGEYYKGGKINEKGVNNRGGGGGKIGDGGDHADDESAEDESAEDESAEDEEKLYWVVPPVQLKKFPKLPFELRRMIWDLVLPDPQVIKISANGYFRREASGRTTTQDWVYRPSAQYRVPYMLSVCRESREEVMVHSVPCFASIFGGTPIYFNAKQDLMYFPDTEALMHFYAGVVPNLVNLSLITGGYSWSMTDFHTVVRQIAIGSVTNMEKAIGGVLNQMRGLESVLIGDKGIRGTGDTLILQLTQGVRALTMGWKDHTVRRPADRSVAFKFVPRGAFVRAINEWEGNIFPEEDLAEETEVGNGAQPNVPLPPPVSMAFNHQASALPIVARQVNSITVVVRADQR
ncbi:uncharacterized protein L3040_006873 [Drepanopeziza brunnea f. sp. 'multigermtubi']|uniref:2EXR domain-containing protein n=1 Tax=Marssonina brunnea f. sp. multigermtubi (strain MB_m1) TaxID=1072389 RepID=K1WKG7_MARBU|nr:uncharacterized protein MBM_08951 [Drepanopeziza brunnea f. sp. 'multigermtubi' MB_m1]EKD12722.1 hypothetical protein MBM_08951 [Drepanopeziza brunnea f. sp. 'multigermtubi' MB_m1]KAJ5037999.1 hypothetical protein L3040_006873 [Drepanopeziza brunnea f. sp. 'multigermtubi']